MGCGASSAAPPKTDQSPQPAAAELPAIQKAEPAEQQQQRSAAAVPASSAANAATSPPVDRAAELDAAATEREAAAPEPVLNENGYLAADVAAVSPADMPAAGTDEMMPPVQVVFVLGNPGSGKSTQCELLAQQYGCQHLSAGDLLRQEVQKESSLGTRISNMIRAGQIVPAQVTLDLLKSAMRASQGPYLIDGFPRSIDSLETFERQCGTSTATIVFELAEDVLTNRLLERGKTSGRTDDNATLIQRRVQTFQMQSLPVVDALTEQGTVHRIDASPPKDAVFKAVQAIYEQYFPSVTS